MSEYDLESIELPRLVGRPLQLFAAALDNGATRPLLLGRLLRDGGILKLRDTRIKESPTVHPLAFVEETAVAHPSSSLDFTALVENRTSHKTEFPFKTICDYATAYRAGVTTPEDVAQKVLDAIAASDDDSEPLRAFIANNRDDIMFQAHSASQRIEANAALSPLDGVPVAVKDEVDQVPYPTTVGTSFMGASPAVEDSTVVARLRAAGALLVGKANMYEIGINPSSFNAHYGTVRNPYNPAHEAGGSSSGPAAAVAAGFCPVAIGADGGGSIRIPAALCGLVGLKATFGRVSVYGAAPLAWSVGHLGPIGATVEDVMLAYATVAGPDPNDPLTQHQPAVTLADWNNENLSGLKLGVYWPWFRHAAPAIVEAGEAMLDKLAQAGATVQEIEIPELNLMRIAHTVTILSEMAASMDNFSEHHKDFGAPVRINLALGRAFTARDYVQAQRIRTRAIAIFERVLEAVDVVVTPTTAVTAPPIPQNGFARGWSDLSTVLELMRFIVPANLTGLPALSFPIGYDGQGLPIGMHLMARPWQEHVLLRIAYAAEQKVERKRPRRYYPILA